MSIPDQLKTMCFNELATVKFSPDLHLPKAESKKKKKKVDEPEYLNIVEELNDFSEWCISEQGVWGVPVPYFQDTKTGDYILSPEITRHVADIMRKQGGSDAWYRLSV